MSISGLVVHAKPDRTNAVSGALSAIKGVDVHMTTEDGKIIITLDNTDDGEAADTIYEMKELEGVISAALIYSHFEEQETGT